MLLLSSVHIDTLVVCIRRQSCHYNEYFDACWQQ